MLGAAGATVYCTGRSVAGDPSAEGRPETIDETAALINEAGGRAIAVQVDHRDGEQVAALFERVKSEAGRLDVLVNDIGGESQAIWDPVWKADTDKGFAFLETAVHTHIVTSRYAAPLLRAQRSGLIVEITDGDHQGFRGALFYDLAKTQIIRLAYVLDQELQSRGVRAVAVTPGFLRSEAMLEQFGVAEANWRDACSQAYGFRESETPCFVGRAVTALAGDAAIARKGGGVFASWNLAREYDFDDIDGRRPDWWGFSMRALQEIVDRGGAQGDEETWFVRAWLMQLQNQPEHAGLLEALRGLSI